MQKKIFATFFFILLLSGIVFYLFNFRKIKHPVSSAIRAIPTNAAFIIESKQPDNLWKKLSETNIMWDELLQTEFIRNLNEQLKFFDSLYIAKPDIKEIFDKHPLLISAHKTDEKQISFLFLFNVPLSLGNKVISDLSGEIANEQYGFSKTEKEYDGANISQFTSSGSTFSYSVYNNTFIGSFNPMLVEDAVRQMNAGASLTDDFGFSSALSTAGENSDANLFVNYKFFPQILSAFAKNDLSENVYSAQNFANWAALDLRLKPNILMLNGFTFSGDTLKKFLSLFENQKPQDAEFVKILPQNTIAFLHLGFSNFREFYGEYTQFIDKKERNEKINFLNRQCSCDIEKKFLSWIENEIAVVFSESSNEQTGFFAVFKSNHVSEAEKMLNEMTDAEEIKMDSAWNNYQIRKINQRGIYPLLLGELFAKLDSGYFTIIENYIVFSNEISTLHNLISNYLSEKTLRNNLNYRSFSEEVSSESNVFFYCAINHSSKLMGEFLHPDYLKKFETNLDILHKFESFAIQFSSDRNNLFYSDAILKYNPSSKTETTTLWETRLDTSISFKPALVTNHYTQAKEIFVQDDASAIYLVSNTGKILWKRNLAEKIMSEIFQIDALNNNKLQLLFNTASNIYLIDRNGKDVHGFPVQLKSPATNGIAVFDYEKNKNYRIVLACNNGMVYNYEKTGNIVSGWVFPKLKDKMRLPVQYFSLNNKDYLTAIDEGGNIYCVDRGGKIRNIIKEKIPVSKKNNFFIETGKDIGKTRIVYTDSTGNIIRLYFGGNVENIKIDDFTENHFFAYTNMNEDVSPEYVFVDKQKLSVYSQNKIRYSIFDYPFESGIMYPPVFFEFPAHSKKIGISDTQSNKIYLFDETGTLHNAFPLYGNTLFSIGDINKDGELYLVVGSGNNIYSYLLK